MIICVFQGLIKPCKMPQATKLFVVVFWGLFVACFGISLEDTQENAKPKFTDEPIQLVRPDLTHKKLVVVEENIKVGVTVF